MILASVVTGGLLVEAGWSLAPSRLREVLGTGRFVAEIGVGIVHHEHPQPPVQVPAPVRELHRRLKGEFDPSGRLNPGLDVLTLAR